VVASLRESGLSLRAIAAATGDSYDTTRRAVAAGDANRSPESGDDGEPAQPITGTDGKTYPARPRWGSVSLGTVGRGRTRALRIEGGSVDG